jgi:hypothetical protein
MTNGVRNAAPMRSDEVGSRRGKKRDERSEECSPDIVPTKEGCDPTKSGSRRGKIRRIESRELKIEKEKRELKFVNREKGFGISD